MSKLPDPTLEIIKFIYSLFPTTLPIPLHSPTFSGNEKRYLIDCIDSTFVSSIGEYVTKFESKIKDYTGASHAIATVNGTSALHMALLVAGVDAETEVITQPLTFVATCNAIHYLNARPVFLDCEPTTLGLCPDALASFLSQHTEIKNNYCYNKNTKKRISACVPVHTFGYPCQIDRIVEICTDYHIPVIEDAAESLGSFCKDQHTGTFGNLGIFSFNGNKIMTTGGGGMIITNDDELAIKAKHLTTTAKVTHPWQFHHDEVGYNYRLPNLNAALGCAQLEQLPTLIQQKYNLHQQYRDYLTQTNTPLFTPPPNTSPNFWLNCIQLSSQEEKEAYLKALNDAKILARPCWQLISSLPPYQDCYTDELTTAKYLYNTIVCVPSSPPSRLGSF